VVFASFAWNTKKIAHPARGKEEKSHKGQQKGRLRWQHRKTSPKGEIAKEFSCSFQRTKLHKNIKSLIFQDELITAIPWR
jgi:hypothetical protein